MLFLLNVVIAWTGPIDRNRPRTPASILVSLLGQADSIYYMRVQSNSFQDLTNRKKASFFLVFGRRERLKLYKVPSFYLC